MYVQNKLKFKEEKQLQLFGCESLWLNLWDSQTRKKYFVSTIYRHSGYKIDKFIDDYSQCLEQLTKINQLFYILGDLNINIKTSNISLQAFKFLNITESNGAIHLSTKPTRVTAGSSSIIDHVITNDLVHKISPFVILSKLTDHYPIMCAITKITPSSDFKTKVSLYRDKKQFNSSSFCDELDKRLGELVVKNFPLTMDNFNNIFDQFVNRIGEIINKHAPLRRLSRKQQKLARKPWITKGIFTSIRYKNSIFRSHFIDGNLNEKQYFRRYTNILAKLKNCSKKLNFYGEFKKSQKNSHLTWKIIRSVLPNKHNRVLPNS